MLMPCRPDAVLLLPRCKTLYHLKQIHAHFVKLPADLTPLICFAASSSNPAFCSHGHFVFQSLRRRTTFLYNTMIMANVRSNQPANAVICYKDMLRDGLIRNNYTFTPLLKACSMMLPEFRHVGLSVHCHVVKLGFSHDPFIGSALIELYATKLDMQGAEEVFDEMPVSDVVLWTTMIDGYGQSGDVGKAREVFDKMPERNVVSWSAMIAVYSRANDFRQVLWLYKRMEEFGLKPNESIIVSALTACAHLGALAQGLWIHSYAEKCQYTSNFILATALVDMYSKCGCVELALMVFEGIREKDSGAWNAIISGMALSGDAAKSLQLFDNMVSSGTRPTEATFVAILNACTHAKLVDQGLALFHDMDRIYNVQPKIEHYACVVDLLSRSGKLEEAEKIVNERISIIETGDADANVWGALLAACRIHSRVDIGDRVWRALLAHKGATDRGIQVLVYNMYREAGWDAQAMSIRRLMAETQSKKTPGCSAVEVDGGVEEFVAGDILHPKGKEICRTLYSLLGDASNAITLYEYDEASHL